MNSISIFLISIAFVFLNPKANAGVQTRLKAYEGVRLQDIAIQERDYKKAIQLQKEKIAHSDVPEREESLYQLSMLYIQDQDLELSFRTFLAVLDSAKASKITAKCDTNQCDATIYEKAFAIYLDPSSASPQETAKRLLDYLMPFHDKNRETVLEFYIAIAYANLGKYREFLDHFYRAYKNCPEHYLAYRTKAVLHVKLLERQALEIKRRRERLAIISLLKCAIDKEPRDTTLYKLIITFAEKESKKLEINECLNKILMANIIIPRTDLLFYVHAAVDAGETCLAGEFVERSSTWYPRSRLVDAAKQYLNLSKAERSFAK